YLPELIASPLQLGQDFRARSLAACLFSAEDYVRASRERRTILGEMRPLYRQFDLFLTANSSAAPRLDRHDILSFWTRPNLTSPFNCTGGPALAVLCGFGREGLPLSLQISRRPVGDSRGLRGGRAVGRPTALPRPRPPPPPGAKPAAIEPRPWLPDTSKVDPAVRAQAEAAAARCGLRLADQIMEELIAVAPWALAMAARLGRQHARADETASIFDP